MLSQLLSRYFTQPVVFLEQVELFAIGGRKERWYRSYDIPGVVFLPMDMVDSGNRAMCGELPFEVYFSRIIDRALTRPARARIDVETDRVGSTLRFGVSLTNHSREMLSAANDATLTALVFEQSSWSTDLPRVAAAGIAPIPSLADGATGRYTLEVPIGDLDPQTTRWVVIADYRPAGSNGAYDTLQAATAP